MASKPLDFEADRAAVRERIAANDAEIAEVRERLGALSYDVRHGTAAQSDRDAASADLGRLQFEREALAQELGEIDRREAAQEEAAQTAERAAWEKRLADLHKRRLPAIERMVDAVLALREASEAVTVIEIEAAGLHRDLGLPGRVILTDADLCALIDAHGIGASSAPSHPERIAKVEQTLRRHAAGLSAVVDEAAEDTAAPALTAVS